MIYVGKSAAAFVFKWLRMIGTPFIKQPSAEHLVNELVKVRCAIAMLLRERTRAMINDLIKRGFVSEAKRFRTVTFETNGQKVIWRMA